LNYHDKTNEFIPAVKRKRDASAAPVVSKQGNTMKRKSLCPRVAVSCVAVTVVILAATATLDKAIQRSVFSRWDEAGARYLDSAGVRALTTFAVVRGINGVISVFQGTDIALSPAGVGVRVAVGEILDPVNDLVERFSWVMLVATTSLGVQKVMMAVGAWLGLQVLLSLSMAVLLIAVWVPRGSGLNPAALAIRLLSLALVIRFCIPAVAYASDRLYRLFLETDYIEATSRLDTIQEKIKHAVPFDGSAAGPEPDKGYFSALQDMLAAGGDLVKIRRTLAALKAQIADYAEHTVRLIVVFILQTILIPIMVLWLILKLLRSLWTGPFTARLERSFFRLIGAPDDRGTSPK
jgi:hypothetical protein